MSSTKLDGASDRGSAVEPRLELLYELVAIRQLEELCVRLFRSAAVRGAMHLYIGQEAVAVGACAALEPHDYVSSSYRSHGWAVCRGIPLPAIVGELLGRTTGCAAGRGGSKHLGDWSRGLLPGNAIVGGHLPMATGLALASKYDQRDQVTLVVFGEGATNQGAFHEALSLAALWKLPVIFLCENNLYSEMTPISVIMPVEDVTERAAGYGIDVLSCDGMDVTDVSATIAAARRHALRSGPIFVEAETYRFCGHHTGDPEGYRTSDEVDRWRSRDPIDLYRRALLEAGASADDLDRVAAKAVEDVAAAESEALAAPEPDVENIGLGCAPWMGVSR